MPGMILMLQHLVSKHLIIIVFTDFIYVFGNKSYYFEVIKGGNQRRYDLRIEFFEIENVETAYKRDTC